MKLRFTDNDAGNLPASFLGFIVHFTENKVGWDGGDKVTDILNAMPGALAQGLIWGIMAIGVYITYRILDFADLTVDGTMCTGGAVCIMMMTSGHNIWVSLLVATLAGMIAGLATGIFNTFMGIPPILAGILSQLGLYSINLKIMGKSNQTISVDNYDLTVSLRYLTDSDIPWYKNPILVTGIFVVVIIAFLYWFFGTERGCSIRATGCNPNMSRAQGINTNLNTIIALMISNGLVALSSALYAQYQGFADVNMGRGAIVIGLAAVIIGTVLFERIFKSFAMKLLAVAIGAVIYYVVLQVVITLGFDTDLLKLLSAIVVAIFLAIPYWKKKYFSKPVIVKETAGDSSEITQTDSADGYAESPKNEAAADVMKETAAEAARVREGGR